MERFNDDLNIIAGLGDDPKRDDGLSTQGFKSIFDKAGLLIQDFINNKLIPYIEKQNVGLPLGGGTMEGPINMNGQKLSGLNAPTEDDEPATKGYADNLKPDLTGYATETYVGDTITNRTVNNFTTTEEGFVADARALKVLNDSKLSMELLWENGSPSSTFGANTINLDLTGVRYVIIEFTLATTLGYRSSALVLNNGVNNQLSIYNSLTGTVYRSCAVSDSGVNFGTGANSSGNTDNNVCIPVCICGFKGASA